MEGSGAVRAGKSPVSRVLWMTHRALQPYCTESCMKGWVGLQGGNALGMPGAAVTCAPGEMGFAAELPWPLECLRLDPAHTRAAGQLPALTLSAPPVPQCALFSHCDNLCQLALP